MNHWGQLGVFDLETTGVDVDSARIVSACIAVLDPAGSVVARWDWLADPGIEIPAGAAAVHGITTERAQALGRDARDVIAEIRQSIEILFSLGHPLVVYNAPYDLTLLDRECRRHGIAPVKTIGNVIDPLVLDKAMDRFRKGKRTLEATAALYNVALDDAHDAGADAVAAGRVALALGAVYADELDIPLPELHARQVAWYAQQAESFADYIRRVKGDTDFVASTQWPMRSSAHPSSVLDTQPIDAPPPRPSFRVPHLDFDTGVLVLDRPALEAAPVRAPNRVSEVENERVEDAAAVAPSVPDAHPHSPPEPELTVEMRATLRPTVLRIAAAIITDATGRTLLVRKRGDEAFSHAAGRIERGESAVSALSRELRAGFEHELDLGSTEYLGSFQSNSPQAPDAVIRAEVFAVAVDGELVADPDMVEMLWVDSVSPGVSLDPLARDTILPLWVARRVSGS